MSSKIVEMSLSEFCDYVSANPGGARKAYEIRKSGGGDMGSVGRERVVYKDRVVEVVREVERVVEKERVVKKNSRMLLGLSGVFFMLWVLVTIGYNVKEVNPVEYVEREVIKEVVVPDMSRVAALEANVEGQERQLKYERRQYRELMDLYVGVKR